MKIKPAHKLNFSCYLRWRREWGNDFLPENGKKIKPGPDGKLPRGTVSALECFVDYESKGGCYPPKQPRLLMAVLLGKALLNFQIKQWAGGVADAASIAWTVTLASIEELEIAYPWLPQWVWVAVENQARKKAERTGKITYAEWKEEMKKINLNTPK